LEDVQPMDGIAEEITESDVSTTSSDDEGDNLEFVPSAWDKFATPTKSALRSPDKSLERTKSVTKSLQSIMNGCSVKHQFEIFKQKKSKGVWFKKQKYHCVYEYPKEPDSPVLQSQDLWKPQIDYASFTGKSLAITCIIHCIQSEMIILNHQHDRRQECQSSHNSPHTHASFSSESVEQF